MLFVVEVRNMNSGVLLAWVQNSGQPFTRCVISDNSSISLSLSLLQVKWTKTVPSL